jgi:hypothetical protein
MGNGNEIIGKIKVKLANARVWYDNARSAARHFAKPGKEQDTALSERYMADSHAIKGYMDELGEMIYLVQMVEDIEVILFEEETREIFQNTCNLHPDKFPINYDYVAFFLCGGNSKQAYIYIKPIACICEEKPPKYYPPSEDDGD